MTMFFESTRIAADALYGDFKFKPYYDSSFHLEVMTTTFCHIARSLYNLAATLLRLVIITLSLLNPFAWLGLPLQGMNLADNAAALGISLVTVALVPIIFTLRTLSSVMFGYEENLNCPGLEDKETADLDLAMKVF